MNLRKGNLQLVYPPNVLAHISPNLHDLFYPKIHNKDAIEVHYSAQLNGHPHIGTLSTLATAFAVGEYLSNQFKIPSTLKFEALENAPTEKKIINNKEYCKMHCDSILNGMSKSEIFMRSFRILLKFFSKETNVGFEIKYYTDFQRNQFVRKSLMDIIERSTEFAPYIAPSEKYLRIRFPCPNCRYMEKSAKSTKIYRKAGKYDITFKSHCADHGDFHIHITPSNENFVDFNTPIRNIIKEAKFIKDARSNNALNLMVDGADWVGMAYQMTDLLHLFGYEIRDLPARIFAPIIEDWSGAKFSKTIYVDESTYDDVPQAFINFNTFQDAFGQEGFRLLLNETRNWVNDTKKLLRNYSLQYMQKLFNV